MTLVGRQITIDDERLDLLAIDAQDRWVVIEVKPGTLESGALAQALCYASSIARLDADELYGKIEPQLGDFGDAERLSERVKQQLAGEEERRQIAVLLVGAGIHSGLERMKEFLDRFGVPISVVSFEVFELDGGPQLLIRDVVDEPIEPPPPRRRLTVETIRRWAVDVGVGEQFDRFVNIAQAAGLAVQPQRASVRIAPPSNRTRFLMYAQPHSGDRGGELRIHVGPHPAQTVGNALRSRFNLQEEAVVDDSPWRRHSRTTRSRMAMASTNTVSINRTFTVESPHSWLPQPSGRAGTERRWPGWVPGVPEPTGARR